MTAALALALGVAACAAPASDMAPARWRPVVRAVVLVLAFLAGAGLCLGLDAAPWWAWLPLMGGVVAWGLWVVSPAASGPWPVLARWATAIAVLGVSALLAQPAPGRLAAAAGAVGVVLLLVGPANEAVSALLALARGVRGADGGGAWAGAGYADAGRADVGRDGRRSGGGAAPGVDAASGAADVPAVSVMRGGRWIGPLERILILLLAGAGAHEAVAAIVAAKGVIRFPEISKDEGGRKAEEFLVGSLASWALAALGILLIRALGL
ncbi:beta-carotene 15,15'-monooxygenase [Actinomyces bowdenii]|uniref:Beta-carotene 15,15'-monooxygenase n=1 Tax=Actinomyces bowdenii TaxID=131109 RepID=A0A853ELV1_9ACTO|nr:beta-carotene 15,15'-monooxygenase [Actinomyces bowdenii]MBF0698045.1 beta-carotene 15,15'-monooxygenase [Actinomyces bowdenii]NYS70218.1 beta-carotene 15,15'-monooxygenase [Actinomyces bowdenii]